MANSLIGSQSRFRALRERRLLGAERKAIAPVIEKAGIKAP